MPNPVSETESSFRLEIQQLVDECKELYRSDDVPWVVGYSGGKDSTAVLQIVWSALSELAPEERRKPVHVISTDTLVENPVVALWVSKSLQQMTESAAAQDLPIVAHRLTPEVADSFWVNLIGRGYPAPRHMFRWCTERLKIKPSNRFITDVVQASGQCILVLGTRRAESARRAHTMKQHEAGRTRARLSPNASLPNSLIYSVIEDWSNDEVWLYLMQFANPWGYDNHDLLSMYQGASADGECPLVVDTTTPSCGSSRFGCWTCTLVEKDKSMSAMIQNDEEKEWMLPLLELRNELDVTDDRHLRDFRRMAGMVQLFHDRQIPGPYVQSAREDWLRKLLAAQHWIQNNGPEYVRDIQLISDAELAEVRRIWVVDKHEMEDSLPGIYEQELGVPYAGPELEESRVFGLEEMRLLREASDSDPLHFELLRELLDVTNRYRTSLRRAGLFESLEKAFRRSAFDDIEDATARARRRRDVLEAAREGDEVRVDALMSFKAESSDGVETEHGEV